MIWRGPHAGSWRIVEQGRERDQAQTARLELSSFGQTAIELAESQQRFCGSGNISAGMRKHIVTLTQILSGCYKRSTRHLPGSCLTLVYWRYRWNKAVLVGASVRPRAACPASRNMGPTRLGGGDSKRVWSASGRDTLIHRKTVRQPEAVFWYRL